MNWRASPSVVALWLKGRGAHRWGPLSEWLRGGTGKLPEGAEAVNAAPSSAGRPCVCALPLSLFILHAPWRFFPELGV